MIKDNPAPTHDVTLADIRGIYPHLPATAPKTTPMAHPAFLVFVHDLDDGANAAGQSFLAQNNNFDTRAAQPLAVAADMCRADYKIFDLTPPTAQSLPASEADLALATSYGMVTVEQGIDCIALHAISDTPLSKIHTLNDVTTHGALNIAACYGAVIAARMAGIPVICLQDLADCLTRIAASEGWHAEFDPVQTGELRDFALALIRQKAESLIG